MNHFENLISQSFLNLHVQMIEEVIRASSVTCRLYFGITNYTDCPNCQIGFDGRSLNIYQSGGPSPFTTGICPVCYGEGKIPNEETEEIELPPIYDSKKWIMISSNIKTPEADVQTLSKFSTFEKLNKAKEIIFDTSIEDSTKQRFERLGKPEVCGLGSSSFISTFWKRIENG